MSQNSANQNNIFKASICHYKHPSSSVSHCQNQGTYQCSHCEIWFCLQHGLKHQEDLKEEIRILLTKAQVKLI